MTSNKKQDDNDGSLTVAAPELENVYNFDKELDCFKNQFADSDNTVPHTHWPTVIEEKWKNFLAKCKNTQNGEWYKSGENGIRKPNGEKPKRVISCIIRIKTREGEFLLSNSQITAYNAFGDPVITSAIWPEQYTKTTFRYETVPNFETGYSERRNTGPSSSQIVYTEKFTTEAARKLFDMRNEGDDIQLVVKLNEGKSVEVKKPNASLAENFDMFVESDFDYLYAANYLSTETKMLNMALAEREGLIDKMTDSDKAAAINAQESLSDKQKMSSYQ